ncbi:hypothetical protein BGX24_001435 [Mortierella sp. AD032]|nr:hypothetical protein BGX24_001435 [Mortierella sp. AD032]
METIYDDVNDPETLDSTLPFANPSFARAVPHDFAQHRFSLDFPELTGSPVKALDNRGPLLATPPYSSPKERTCYLYNDRALYAGVYPAAPRSNVHNAPSTTDTAAIKYDQAGQAINTGNATNIRHDQSLLDNNNKRDFLDWNIDPPANKSSDAGDTSDKQETFTSITNRSLYTQGSVGSFLGFLHGRHNYPRRSRSPSSLYPSSTSEDSVDPQESAALSPPAQKKAPIHNVYNPGLSAPIPIQQQLVSPSSKQPWRKAPTPPPSLLSPSLTTTKVSRSLSTECGIAGSGSLQSQTTRTLKDSRSGNIFISAENVDSTTIPLPSSPCNNLIGLGSSIDPDPPYQDQHAPNFVGEPKDVGPPACSCVEHYRYAILSTIVPLPLDLCFEWLYSAQGLGHGDQLLRKAHNTVNSSVHIDVSPWTKPESENYATKTNEWETKTRRLHYTVTFKIPMRELIITPALLEY